MEAAEIEKTVETVVSELGCEGIRDMGRLMGALRERYPGQMDFGMASGMAKQLLQ